MSRGFVREGDQEEAPVIPARAPLPDEVPNYVTANGKKLLLDEMAELEHALKETKSLTENERRREITVINGKIQLLNERINSAQEVLNENVENGIVRFGATVRFKNLDNQSIQSFKIVGVDEANTKQKKIAFTTPVAKALIGKMQNETTVLNLGGEARNLQILGIEYT